MLTLNSMKEVSNLMKCTKMKTNFACMCICIPNVLCYLETPLNLSKI